MKANQRFLVIKKKQGGYFEWKQKFTQSRENKEKK